MTALATGFGSYSAAKYKSKLYNHAEAALPWSLARPANWDGVRFGGRSRAYQCVVLSNSRSRAKLQSVQVVQGLLQGRALSSIAVNEGVPQKRRWIYSCLSLANTVVSMSVAAVTAAGPGVSTSMADLASGVFGVKVLATRSAMSAKKLSGVLV